MAIDVEDLQEVLKDYEKLETFTATRKSSVTVSEKKLFFDFYNQYKLNQATRNLVWATVLLVAVAGLQLIKELSGPETTLVLLQDLGSIVFYVFIAIAVFKLLKSAAKYVGSWIKKCWGLFKSAAKYIWLWIQKCFRTIFCVAKEKKIE